MPNDLHDSRRGLVLANIYAKLLRELARVRAASGADVELETWHEGADGKPTARGLAFGTLVRASYWDEAAEVMAFVGRFGPGRSPALVKVSRAEYEDVLRIAIDLTGHALGCAVPGVEPPWGAGCERVPRDGEHFRAIVRRLRQSWGITPQRMFDGVVRTERERKAKGRRKPRPSDATRPLTGRQLEAVHLYGECKGNFAEMGRRMGIDRKTAKQHYLAGTGKLGRKYQATKVKKQGLPHDGRGQVDLAEHNSAIVEGRKLDGKRHRGRVKE